MAAVGPNDALVLQLFKEVKGYILTNNHQAISSTLSHYWQVVSLSILSRTEGRYTLLGDALKLGFMTGNYKCINSILNAVPEESYRSKLLMDISDIQTGYSAIHYATLQNDQEFLKLLLDTIKDPILKRQILTVTTEQCDQTPMELAERRDCNETAKLLKSELDALAPVVAAPAPVIVPGFVQAFGGPAIKNDEELESKTPAP